MATNVIGNTASRQRTQDFCARSRPEEIVEIAKVAFESVKIVGTDTSAEMGAIGPLASKQQFEKVRAYIQCGIEEGATLVTGGLEFLDDPTLPESGSFVRPTIFKDVRNDMRIAREEIFGPVFA